MVIFLHHCPFLTIRFVSLLGWKFKLGHCLLQLLCWVDVWGTEKLPGADHVNIVRPVWNQDSFGLGPVHLWTVNWVIWRVIIGVFFNLWLRQTQSAIRTGLKQSGLIWQTYSWFTVTVHSDVITFIHYHPPAGGPVCCPDSLIDRGTSGWMTSPGDGAVPSPLHLLHLWRLVQYM